MIAKLKKATKGFTLIELLVVIAIIGLLASIVLVSLTTARQKARDSRRVGDLRQVQLALELYFDANTGTGYPDSANTVTCPAASGCTPINYTGVAAQGWAALTAPLSPLYMATVPNDPLEPAAGYTAAGRHYAYITTDVAGTKTQYVMGAALEDSANAAFGNDIDGISVLGARGIDCADTVTTDQAYCVRN